jgi:hypothetical protein
MMTVMGWTQTSYKTEESWRKEKKAEDEGYPEEITPSAGRGADFPRGGGNGTECGETKLP